MDVNIDTETGDLITGIATYLNGLDGGSRSVADIIRWTVGAALSLRPDIVKSMAAETVTQEEN